MMKRILTSLLVLLVLTISVHPIIAMHFCNGDLHSFSLVSKSETCCTFENVEIITDNFTVEHTNTTVQKPNTFTLIHASVILDYLINLFTPDAIIKSSHPISPIGLRSTTLKFLSYICVYRL